VLVSKAYFAADSNLTKLTVAKIRLTSKKGATLASCSFVYLREFLIARLPLKKEKENGLTQKPTKKGGLSSVDNLPAVSDSAFSPYYLTSHIYSISILNQNQSDSNHSQKKRRRVPEFRTELVMPN